jgi:hypothetical protein
MWRSGLAGNSHQRGDATMQKYFTPPIVIPIALVALVVVAALLRTT